jgi:hypothetical protein
MIVALVAVPPMAVLFLVFYFLRSSKEMPKNWREFVLEMKIQAAGTQGLTEDTVMRFRNKVGNERPQNDHSSMNSIYFMTSCFRLSNANK